MSATIFLAICILGCDFLLYFLYQWTYGEKRRGLRGRSRVRKTMVNQPNARPFLVAERKEGARRAQYPDRMRPRVANAPVDTAPVSAHFGEARAYRRIAASFAHSKR